VGGLWERDVKGKIVASLVIVVFGSFSFFMSGLDLFFFFLGYWNLFDNLGFGPLLSSRKEVEGVIELDLLPIFFRFSSDFFRFQATHCSKLQATIAEGCRLVEFAFSSVSLFR